MSTELLPMKPLLMSEITDSKQKTETWHSSKRIICGLAMLILILIAISLILIFVVFTEQTNEYDNAGLYGWFPCFGGNIQNQQISPSFSSNAINNNTIKNVSLLCKYESLRGVSLTGYITIDDDNNAYFADSQTGSVKCIDLNNCNEKWKVNLSEILLGKDVYDSFNKTQQENDLIINVRHSITLYKDSKGIKSVLIGAPNGWGYDYMNSLINYTAFAISLKADNGDLRWTLNVGTGRCIGFMVDGHFAFGSVASSPGLPSLFIKIDVDIPQIVAKWYSIPPSKIDPNAPSTYSGASLWSWPAIIGDYVMFGSGNLYSYPPHIEQCLLGNFEVLPLNESYPFNVCGYHDITNKIWRCLEKDIYVDSFVVLNKNTFQKEFAVPLQGVDCWDGCDPNDNVNQSQCSCSNAVLGVDADLAAVSAYLSPMDGHYYSAILDKSGTFYVFEIPSGHLMISKKIGPWSYGGGGQWGIAVDPTSMIAIATITGGIGNPFKQFYKQIMADNTTICWRTGSIHAIDLKNGNLIWQVINPYGTINNCSDSIFDEYVDRTLNQTCEYNEYLNNNNSDYINVNVVIPELTENDLKMLPLDVSNRARFVAPVTISNNMVYIPSFTGDVFVHNLFSGKYIHKFQCPNYQINITNDNNETITTWNRYGIKGGVSVVNDRIVWYCGGGVDDPKSTLGNQMISMALA